jgi:hypothetical protein
MGISPDVRYESNPKIEEHDQDVRPLIQNPAHTNERNDKKFDLDMDEEDHRSIDSFNFGDEEGP